MQSPPFPRYLVIPKSKYSPQHHILKHPQLPFLPQCQRPSFTPVQRTHTHTEIKQFNSASSFSQYINTVFKHSIKQNCKYPHLNGQACFKKPFYVQKTVLVICSCFGILYLKLIRRFNPYLANVENRVSS